MKKLLMFFALTTFSLSAQSFVPLKDLGVSKKYKSKNIHTMLGCGYDGRAYLADVDVKAKLDYYGRTSSIVGKMRRSSKNDSSCKQYRTTTKSNNPMPQDLESYMYQQFMKLYQ